MKALVALMCLVAAASAVSFIDLIREEWVSFKMEFNKTYEKEIDEYRMKIFAENKYKIARHNQRFKQGLVSYRMKQNKYADMLPYEFIHTMNGFIGFNNTVKDNKGLKSLQKGEDIRPAIFLPPAHLECDLPSQVDWRMKGAVTEVKDQGSCGSCWAFSATGALEGQHFRKTGKLVPLSEQNLIDCSTAYGNDGCKGGLASSAFKYISDNNGIDTEKSYPYEAAVGKCRYNPRKIGADNVGFVKITAGDERKLMEAVATVGPVSVVVDATGEDFQFYSGGVYYNENCSTKILDHAMLVVGYGTDEGGKDYWLVKNSYGLSWGEQGYIKMARNRENNCGIASEASYPLV